MHVNTGLAVLQKEAVVGNVCLLLGLALRTNSSLQQKAALLA